MVSSHHSSRCGLHCSRVWNRIRSGTPQSGSFSPYPAQSHCKGPDNVCAGQESNGSSQVGKKLRPQTSVLPCVHTAGVSIKHPGGSQHRFGPRGRVSDVGRRSRPHLWLARMSLAFTSWAHPVRVLPGAPTAPDPGLPRAPHPTAQGPSSPCRIRLSLCEPLCFTSAFRLGPLFLLLCGSD